MRKPLLLLVFALATNLFSGVCLAQQTTRNFDLSVVRDAVDRNKLTATFRFISKYIEPLELDSVNAYFNGVFKKIPLTDTQSINPAYGLILKTYLTDYYIPVNYPDSIITVGCIDYGRADEDIINIIDGLSVPKTFFIEAKINLNNHHSDSTLAFETPKYLLVNRLDTLNSKVLNYTGNDSIIVEMINPLRNPTVKIFGYRQADSILVNPTNGSVEFNNSELVWSKPERIGLYSFAVKATKYTSGRFHSSIIKDFIVTVFYGNIGTSIYETTADKPTIKIYPNPSTNKHTIQIDTYNGAQIDIALYSNTGQLLRSHRTNNSTVEYNLADLPMGSYFYKVKAGSVLKMIPFVKQ